MDLMVHSPEWSRCWNSSLDQPILNFAVWNGNVTRNPLEQRYEDDEDSTDFEDYDDLKTYRIPYFEVSAKSGDNIEAAFYHIAKTVQLPQFEFLIEGDTITWDDDFNGQSSNRCCF